ncbi:MAG: TldD/PmbA family protein [Chloroflexi bacterium]|nr:TldD/PmbA family protein [Chloroflexota bacterium]
MMGRQAALALLDKALGFSRAQETDIYLSAQDLGLSRFAGGAIHQNVAHGDIVLNVRSVAGKRLGRATTNDLSDAGVQRAVETARQNALLMPEDPGFMGLPEPSEPAKIDSWDEATAQCSPEARAKIVRGVCLQGREHGLNVSGACRTGVQEIAVVSSRGARAYHAGTFAGLIINTMSGTSAGWAKGGSWRLSDLDTEALGQEAVSKAVDGQDPVAIEPGRYPVVLDTYAVDDILEALSLYGMGAQTVQEGRSWMNDFIGTQDARGAQAMSPSVTIWDDGSASRGWPVPFDAEGVPRRRVDIITGGVVKSPVHNSYTAGKEGTVSTGHQAYFTGGPVASNLFMQEGDSSLQDLIGSTQRGLYITRFFYTRLAHIKGCVMTGMTRDGTFMIENGRITHPVKDLRFTQSYVEALAGVEHVGRESKLVLNEVGFATRVPALKLSSFNFTGVTV